MFKRECVVAETLSQESNKESRAAIKEIGSKALRFVRLAFANPAPDIWLGDLGGNGVYAPSFDAIKFAESLQWMGDEGGWKFADSKSSRLNRLEEPIIHTEPHELSPVISDLIAIVNKRSA
jgi:hypothetical protein